MGKRNPNALPKGSKKRVEPIREIADIKKIKNLLMGKPMYNAIFVFGINTNLRSVDILSIKTDQVKDPYPGMEIIVYEKKTDKTRRINLNKEVVKALKFYMASRQFKNEEYLFASKKSSVHPHLLPATLSTEVKKWCKAVGLRGNFASHTLRKTWGYHQRVTFNVSLPILMECFNHSNQKQTLDYLCIQPQEIREIYENSL